ncbi:MarC family protein [Candidatus Woesearchaeota archaeon]|nr:MarC family protein [Candidatus Woesearchaeota archaeon]
MLSIIIVFLVMLNPFALFLYLNPVMEELSHKDFLKVLLRATLISFVIFSFFLFFGDAIIQRVFLINFDSFRIFGGIIIFSFAFLYIVKGQHALITMKESLDDLASEIALPFMIGAGTISLSILMSNQYPVQQAFGALVTILVLNYLFIVGLKFIKDQLSKRKLKIAFDKNMQILLRLVGFFVGAIGVNMIITGITNIILG